MPKLPNTPVRWRARWHLLGLAVAFTIVSPGPGAETLPLRNIDGVICIQTLLRTEAGEAPAYLAIDLGTRGPLLLHYRTAALLGIQSRGTVDVLPDSVNIVLRNVDTVARELEPLETLTRTHAEALKEIPIAGVLGMPAFGTKMIALDIHGNELTLFDPGEEAASAASWSESAATVFTPYVAESYGYWLNARSGDGQPARVRFATSEFDTRIDVATGIRLGAPDGQLSDLIVGDLNLARYAVFRPSDLSAFPDPRPDVVLGTGLLSHFGIRIDPGGQGIWWTPLAEPDLPDEERGLYQAQSRRDADAIEAFLEAHADSRLAPEAAESLLALRVAETNADTERIRRALQRSAEVAEPHLRAGALVRIADEFIAQEQERPDAYTLASLALDVGEPYANSDLNATAIHQINARRGLIALLQGDHLQAHRYLLSAAFGLPKDPYVNLWLGRLYEVKNQLPRAWSRYLESALHDEPPIGARRGLDRLNNNPAFREYFTMANASGLIEGRVVTFRPAQRSNANTAQRGQPVHLVELFSGLGTPETQAAELAFDALASELNADTVFIQYHLEDGLNNACADARREFYGVKALPAAYFDGAGPVSASGDDGAAARVFDTYGKSAYSPEGAPHREALSGQAVLRDGTILADVKVNVAEVAGHLALHLVLCERTVMALGANNQVLHGHIARATFEAQGDWRHGGVCRAEAKLADVQELLKAQLARLEENAGGRLVMKPTFIDPQGIDLAVFVQDIDTRRVVDAVMLPVLAE